MNPYFESMILTANPVELIRMVYGRATKSVADARKHLAAGRIPERSASVTQAWMAVMELTNALSPNAAPELTERLRALYGYIQQRLLDGNVQQRDAPLAEALSLLNTLSEAWASVLDPITETAKDLHSLAQAITPQMRGTAWNVYEAPVESAHFALSA